MAKDRKKTYKLLDVNQVLVDLEDKPLTTISHVSFATVVVEMQNAKEDEWKDIFKKASEDLKDITLGSVLLKHLTEAGTSEENLTDDEKILAWEVGRKIGLYKSKQPIALSMRQYNLLKKIIDKGTVKRGDKYVALFGIVISVPVKEMVDAAEQIKK